jgi:hypothetical protein
MHDHESTQLENALFSLMAGEGLTPPLLGRFPGASGVSLIRITRRQNLWVSFVSYSNSPPSKSQIPVAHKTSGYRISLVRFMSG